MQACSGKCHVSPGTVPFTFHVEQTITVKLSLWLQSSHQWCNHFVVLSTEMFHILNTQTQTTLWKQPRLMMASQLLMEMCRPVMAQNCPSVESQLEDMFHGLGNARSTASPSHELETKAKQIRLSAVPQRTKSSGSSTLSSRQEKPGEKSWGEGEALWDLHPHPFLIKKNILLEAGP